MSVPRAGPAVWPPLAGLSRVDGSLRSWVIGAVIIVWCFLLWVVPAGLSDLQGADESRYVLVAREWLAGDGGITLKLFGEPYDQKPPLPFLLLALMLKITGGEVVSLTVRLPSILLGTAAVLATWRIARRHLGEEAGIFAALVLMTSTQWMMDTPTAELNVMFAGWFTLSMACWFLRPVGVVSWWRAAGMWLMLAAAFFTKGPLALLMAASVISVEALLRKSWAPFKESRFIAGFALNLLLIGIWLYAQQSEVGSDFVRNQVGGETVDRFLKGSHEAPFHYYMVRLFTSIMFPWAFFLIPATIEIWRGARAKSPLLATTLFGWGAVPLLILTLSSGKRESYPIPLLPGLSIAVGYYLSQFLSRVKSIRPASNTLMAAAVVGGGVLVLGAVAILLHPDLGWTRDAYFSGWQLLPACLIVAAFWTAAWGIRRYRDYAATPIFAMAIFMSLFAVAVSTLVRPASGPSKSSRSFSEFMENYLESAQVPHVVGLIGRAERAEYHVYADYLGVPLDFDKDIVGDRKALPEVLLLRTKDFDKGDVKLAAGMKSRGYTLAGRTMALGDTMSIYGKVNEQPPLAAAQNEFRFGIVGDTGRDSETAFAISRELLKRHQKKPLDAVLLLGDNIYGDDPFDVAVVERFENVFRGLRDANVPFHAVLGNHDVSNGYATHEITYPGFGMDGKRYYEESLGDDLVTFYFLDNYSLRTSPEQFIWLKERLEASRSKWRFVITHEPLRSDTDVHSIDDQVFRLIGKLLIREDVQGVFSGHLHFYERPAFARPLQITSGSGSKAAVQQVDHVSDATALYSSKGAFLMLTVTDDGAMCESISEDGALIEKFSIPMNGSAPTVAKR
jgi:4-amino-4-deoxy-L-arabinose transferase-like glycosyltransferase